MTSRTIAYAVALLLLSVQSAWSQEAAEAPQRLFSEARVGILAHDQAPIVDNVESGTDLNLELLFTSPRALRGIAAPRPHIGVTIASEGTSLAYAGLTWERDYSSGWFLTGSLGLAVHDGDPLLKEDQTREEFYSEKALGCRVQFHATVGGGYRLSPRWNVALHYEHLSNANLCESNEGLENIGVRVGRMF